MSTNIVIPECTNKNKKCSILLYIDGVKFTGNADGLRLQVLTPSAGNNEYFDKEIIGEVWSGHERLEGESFILEVPDNLVKGVSNVTLEIDPLDIDGNVLNKELIRYKSLEINNTSN